MWWAPFSGYIQLLSLLIICSFRFLLVPHPMIIQVDSSIDASYSFPLLFEKLPEVNQEGSQWTDCEIKDTINLVYLNLSKLDSYLSFLVRTSSFFLGPLIIKDWIVYPFQICYIA